MKIKYKYKVVKRKSRMSCMINGNSKYARQYLDGEKVYAHGNSLGVMVFETLDSADNFASIWNDYNNLRSAKDLVILKVIPIGRGKRVVWIARGIDTMTLDNFYSTKHTCFRSQAPDRTMAYPGVEVIGEHVWK